MLKLSVLLLLLSLLAACEPAAVQPPERAAGIPEDAVWSGGSDGGAWIRCHPVAEAVDKYDCTTYFESTGEVWEEGIFVLRSVRWDQANDRPIFSTVTSPDSLQYSGFDGHVIHLRDSLVLIQPDSETAVR